jgi:hypothetical protein
VKEGYIAWNDSHIEQNYKSYFFIIENDSSGQLVRKFKEMVENSFSIPSRCPDLVYDQDNSKHLDSKQQYSNRYEIFIPSFLTNRVIAIRKYMVTLLCFDEQLDTFNCGDTILEHFEDTIKSAILVNLENELVYVTEKYPTKLKLYNFNKEKVTSTLEFGHEIVCITNIKQQL